MHTITFFYTDPDGQLTIDLAFWEILHLEPELEEIRIRTSQSILNIVIGYGLHGKFVYLPDHGVGFPADSPSDTSFGIKHLTSVLGCKDAAAVSSAFLDYASY